MVQRMRGAGTSWRKPGRGIYLRKKGTEMKTKLMVISMAAATAVMAATAAVQYAGRHEAEALQIKSRQQEYTSAKAKEFDPDITGLACVYVLDPEALSPENSYLTFTYLTEGDDGRDKDESGNGNGTEDRSAGSEAGGSFESAGCNDEYYDSFAGEHYESADETCRAAEGASGTTGEPYEYTEADKIPYTGDYSRSGEDGELACLGMFTVTAYCACPVCCGSYSSGYTASGTYAAEGRTVACNSLPMGTHIYIEGCGNYTVEDTGWSPYGESWLDIFFEDHDAALAFGVKDAEVYLIG